MSLFRRLLRIVSDAGNGWVEHKAPRMGAALSYYTAFSIGPILLIAIAIVGAVFGEDAAKNHIFESLHREIGGTAASIVEQAVEGASKPATSIIATIAGIVVLLFGASGVFGELHDAMNGIWGLRPRPHAGLRNFVRERFLSFAMVLGTGFLLLVSFVFTAVLAAVGAWVSGGLPGGELLWQTLNFVFSLGMVSLLFAALFKYVPDVHIRWREPLWAGLATALLFSVGKLGLGIYVGKASVASSYGAASSLIVLLVWVYYSSQILYFGAELTRALNVAARAGVAPARGAVPVDQTPAESRPLWRPRPT